MANRLRFIASEHDPGSGLLRTYDPQFVGRVVFVAAVASYGSGRPSLAEPRP